jgi:hypothetical protein
MGSDTTVPALKWQFAVPIKANVQLIKDARGAGLDCKNLNFGMAGSKGQNDDFGVTVVSAKHTLHRFFFFRRRCSLY